MIRQCLFCGYTRAKVKQISIAHIEDGTTLFAKIDVASMAIWVYYCPDDNHVDCRFEEENFILSRLEVQQIALACVTLLLRLCILTTWLR